MQGGNTFPALAHTHNVPTHSWLSSGRSALPESPTARTAALCSRILVLVAVLVLGTCQFRRIPREARSDAAQFNQASWQRSAGRDTGPRPHPSASPPSTQASGTCDPANSLQRSGLLPRRTRRAAVNAPAVSAAKVQCGFPRGPPHTDPYVQWCDRESPRGPTYVDCLFEAAANRAISTRPRIIPYDALCGRFSLCLT
jgi:hypothetical protein